MVQGIDRWEIFCGYVDGCLVELPTREDTKSNPCLNHTHGVVITVGPQDSPHHLQNIPGAHPRYLDTPRAHQYHLQSHNWHPNGHDDLATVLLPPNAA